MQSNAVLTSFHRIPSLVMRKYSKAYFSSRSYSCRSPLEGKTGEILRLRDDVEPAEGEDGGV
jgi:hypothetical protein